MLPVRKLLIALAASLIASSAWAAPTLMVGNATGQANSMVSLPITFDPTTNSVAAFQFDLILPNGLTPASVTLGSPLSSAIKMERDNLVNANTWRFMVLASTAASNQTPAGLLIQGQNAITNGIVLRVQMNIAPGTTVGTVLPVQIFTGSAMGVSTGTTSATPVTAVYADPSANGVAAGASTNGSVTVSALSPCDVNQSGGIDVADAVFEVNGILNAALCTPAMDINQTAGCDTGDAIRIVNVILGGSCVTGP